ncbi:hypothetical protein TRFO_09544 [Tritrichomonas foetus]|uniref:Uncharacterized protein n=1 Tax=Tritrichomonas foetus TaxID=1144522 RepID=A0A1J4JJ57_9EUKA|nr:hypothetical protein TRFO_09544 [Tritrichomonas foetus]|eukprot:OHS97268.1 hypothetical protein TRFO_09544 [Tritrichomonas foetus]
MEPLIHEDFVDKSGDIANSVHMKVMSRWFGIEEVQMKPFDFDYWNKSIIEFNNACENQNNDSIISCIQTLIDQINSRDDLIAEFLYVLENTKFYENAGTCIYSNDDKLVFKIAELIGRITFCSSDFVLHIFRNGFMGKILIGYKENQHMEQTVDVFFFIFNMIFEEDPDLRFFLIQNGIFDICSEAVLTQYNFEVFETIFNTIFSFFTKPLKFERLPVNPVSNLMLAIRTLFESMLLPKFPQYSFEQRVKIVLMCLKSFSLYCSDVTSASVLLMIGIPQLCYWVLTPDVQTDIRVQIGENLVNVINHAFYYGPQNYLSEFAKIINIQILAVYINLEYPMACKCVLTIIHHLFAYSKEALIAANNSGLLTTLFELVKDADFSMKSTIIGVICSVIVNAPPSIPLEMYLNNEIIDSLIDMIDTEVFWNKEIPGALLILSEMLPKDDEIYSVISQFIHLPELQPT